LAGTGAAVPATTVCADAVKIIADWDPETLTVTRNTPTYESGMGVDSWSAIGTFSGDWQPVSGRVMRQEEGLKIKSNAFIIAPCDIDVTEGDRIYRDDGTFEYVNYVSRYKGHITIFLTRVQGSE